MIFIYILLIGLSGLGFQLLLNKFKIIDFKKINKLEFVSITFFTGILFYTLYVLLLGIFKIEYNRFVFIPIIFLDIISIIILYLKRKEIIFLKFEMSKRDIFPAILLLIIFINYFICAYSHLFLHADSFAVWGLNAKNYYLGKSLYFNVNTGLESYPPLLPTLYSGYYILIDGIKENVIKTIPVIISFFGILNIIGITNRKKISNYKSLFVIVVILLLSPSLKSMFASSYGDITLAIVYSLSTIYFVDMLFSNEYKTNGLFYLILFNLGCLTKNDCLYMCVFNLFVLIIFFFIKKKGNFKCSRIYAFLMFILSIATAFIWNNFCSMAYASDISATTTISNLGNSTLDILPDVVRSMNNTLFHYWSASILFCVVIVLLFKNIEFGKKDQNKNSAYYLLIVSFILFNAAFLMVCYLTIFGRAEAIYAASFERYYSRVLFLVIYLIIMLLEKNSNKELKLYD